jgi:hypothetical protein
VALSPWVVVVFAALAVARAAASSGNSPRFCGCSGPPSAARRLLSTGPRAVRPRWLPLVVVVYTATNDSYALNPLIMVIPGGGGSATAASRSALPAKASNPRTNSGGSGHDRLTGRHERVAGSRSAPAVVCGWWVARSRKPGRRGRRRRAGEHCGLDCLADRGVHAFGQAGRTRRARRGAPVRTTAAGSWSMRACSRAGRLSWPSGTPAPRSVGAVACSVYPAGL